MIQKTLVLIKPDAVRRGLVGEIISRFEKVGLKIVAMKFICPGEAIAKEHYKYDDIAHRHGEHVWKRLIKFITSGPVIALVMEGDDACHIARKIIGSTEPKNAVPGTIRGDYAHHSYKLSNYNDASICNLVHASSKLEEANNEIEVWFNEEEIYEYRRDDDNEHIYG